MSLGSKIRIGTCSWAERTLVESGEYYPKGVSSPEDRLRYYASSFDTVEVDSTYYAIPSGRTAELWAERTPEDFTFHVKVYGALTGHGTDPRTLPKHLREILPADDKEKNTIYIKEPELLKAVSDTFVSSLAPLRSAGKLGFLVFQYPPWFTYGSGNMDLILKSRELARGVPMAVEFRHGSWLTERRREHVLKFLRENGITYITADEPQFGTLATVPFLPDTTTEAAYLRLHGRNTDTWLRKGIETSQRYNYLYSGGELREFAMSARELSLKAKMVFVMFNNCHGGFAVRNALEMMDILR